MAEILKGVISKAEKDKKSRAVIALILVQSVCAVFFLGDVINDAITMGRPAFTSAYLWLEAAAVVALSFGILFEVRYLIDLMDRSDKMERSVQVASDAVHEVIEDYFNTWTLTPAERDVAMFTIKGLSISEIAALRDSREGTIKTHLNAIYRKAGVTGRSQLVSLLIEDLMGEPLVSDQSASANT
ncbi:MAG: helix-turn-helix transcriptional regulator [Hyphomicrobiales bacterium]